MEFYVPRKALIRKFVHRPRTLEKRRLFRRRAVPEEIHRSARNNAVLRLSDVISGAIA
jgi:hypothetical protein